ncbi:MAG TPA: hypothetical protein VJO35_17080 [Terriglobales bacterium]|nr:hypothetical protein [Terriglobales bacterium]
MKRHSMMVTFLMLCASLVAHPTPSASDKEAATPITVRGCIRSERGNYVLIEERTGAIYALQNVGNKLQGYLRKQVEVTGETEPGSVKTGVRPEKAGSNPSDTVYGVDGVPLQIKDIQKDIRIISPHCKAADQ